MEDALADGELLRSLYLEEGLSAKEIAKRIGTSAMSVGRALNKHGVPKRSKAQAQGKMDWRLEDPEFLRGALETMTIQELADTLGVHYVNLSNRLKRLGLRPRDDLGIVRCRLEPLDETTLRLLYVDKRLSIAAVADHLKVSYRRVRESLNFWGFEIRTGARASISDEAFSLLSDKDGLAAAYQSLGAELLSTQLNIDTETVRHYLITHEIERIAPGKVSYQEKSLLEALLRVPGIPLARTSVRDVVPGFELDIYFPDQGLAIEYNGLYWHSERKKPRNYHYNKWLACQESGIDLIQIWEDDWRIRPGLVLRTTSHRLGLSPAGVPARKCRPCPVGPYEAREFLDAYHLQGFVPGSIYLGLRSQGDIVAICCLRKRKDGWELTRYATSQRVTGGFSRLLAYFRRENIGRIYTFADLCISNGSLYRKTGFTEDRILPPDYKYIVKNVRVHKSSYRISRFKNDPNLKYEPGLTETELAQLNGLVRIYDAGKIRFVLE